MRLVDNIFSGVTADVKVTGWLDSRLIYKILVSLCTKLNSSERARPFPIKFYGRSETRTTPILVSLFFSFPRTLFCGKTTFAGTPSYLYEKKKE